MLGLMMSFLLLSEIHATSLLKDIIRPSITPTSFGTSYSVAALPANSNVSDAAKFQNHPHHWSIPTYTLNKRIDLDVKLTYNYGSLAL